LVWLGMSPCLHPYTFFQTDLSRMLLELRCV